MSDPTSVFVHRAWPDLMACRTAMTAAEVALLQLPSDVTRFRHAQAVEHGLVPASILASRDLERYPLGPLTKPKSASSPARADPQPPEFGHHELP